MEFKVRPFAARSVGAHSVAGVIRGSQYIFIVGQAEYSIPTERVGDDAQGIFAIVPDGEVDLGFGYLLSVSIDTDEMGQELGLPPGCRITLRLKGDEAPILDQLRTQGSDPKEMNVLVPPEFSVSVYFNSSGVMNGSSSGDCDRPEHYSH